MQAFGSNGHGWHHICTSLIAIVPMVAIVIVFSKTPVFSDNRRRIDGLGEGGKGGSGLTKEIIRGSHRGCGRPARAAVGSPGKAAGGRAPFACDVVGVAP